jgi:pyrimidine-nucleoside phosphorylase
MLIMGGAARTLDEAQARVQASIQDGSALETLRHFVTLNGGDAKALDDFNRLPQPGQVVEVRADRDGYLAAIDGRALGILAMDLGAGRRDRNDVLDLGVGIRVHVQVGSKVVKNDPLFTVYARRGDQVVAEPFLRVLELVPGPVLKKGWLLQTINC